MVKTNKPSHTSTCFYHCLLTAQKPERIKDKYPYLLSWSSIWIHDSTLCMNTQMTVDLYHGGTALVCSDLAAWKIWLVWSKAGNSRSRSSWIEAHKLYYMYICHSGQWILQSSSLPVCPVRCSRLVQGRGLAEILSSAWPHYPWARREYERPSMIPVF